MFKSWSFLEHSEYVANWKITIKIRGEYSSYCMSMGVFTSFKKNNPLVNQQVANWKITILEFVNKL